MAFSIIKPGLLDTIQDMGRNGYGNWGINPGGAMDRYAAQVANLLVGNCEKEAILEIHFPFSISPPWSRAADVILVYTEVTAWRNGSIATAQTSKQE
jgi:allophanate hydrolase subunit 2